ncbi:hypothetical protein PUN28_015811 [Cardiocondyla obscurior]|uniref:Uncharacterized protein n=1 Tax=Cardiocondyla obscurior TaxID=286306 RepID=A0AAW2EPE9_9HYME
MDHFIQTSSEFFKVIKKVDENAKLKSMLMIEFVIGLRMSGRCTYSRSRSRPSCSENHVVLAAGEFLAREDRLRARARDTRAHTRAQVRSREFVTVSLLPTIVVCRVIRVAERFAEFASESSRKKKERRLPSFLARLARRCDVFGVDKLSRRF